MRHLIKTRSGEAKRVDLTPIRAIRLFCLECMGHSPAEVRGCSEPLCPLWPYRLGRDPGKEKAALIKLAGEGEPKAQERGKSPSNGGRGLFD